MMAYPLRVADMREIRHEQGANDMHKCMEHDSNTVPSTHPLESPNNNLERSA